MAARPDDLAWSLVPAAQALAARHTLSPGPPAAIPAWKEHGAAGRWLRDARTACAEAPPEAGKAAEWLLDNDYQVHRAIRQIHRDLPASFYRRLPALAGETEPLPRVFALAHDFLRVSRLQVSLAIVVKYVKAYQTRHPLTIAELWAFPTMLRIACLEILVTALTPMLRGKVALPFAPSEQAADPHSLDESGRVARAIANLGAISAIPWDEFFDATSRVEALLAGDPSGAYARSDFETRDRCRRVVEELGRHSTGDETDIARHAVRLASAAAESDRERHVGYWLLGEGLARLRAEIGARFSRGRRVRDFVLRHPGPIYAGALALCSAGALLLPALYLFLVQASLAGWLLGLAASFVPATILAVTVVHWAITRALPPRILPKLDCEKGLPKDCPTVIAMPVLVAGVDDVSGLIEQMEAHWLANADPMLRIALLADLPDATEEQMPGDAAILRRLEEQLAELNIRHGRRKPGPFHLLVRPRRYNPAEGCWMAWERKRGKLEQFNRLLLEGDESAFCRLSGHRDGLAGLRFVVTVDADTMLPNGSVARLVGALAPSRKTVAKSGRYSVYPPRHRFAPSPEDQSRATASALHRE